MITITTLSDKHYVLKGLALYNSLVNTTTQDFILHYLAVDDYTYQFLTNLNLPKMKVWNMSSISSDPDFTTLKNNTKYIVDGFCSYCFALASFFTYYISTIIESDYLFYIDSDIILYEDIYKIILSSQNKSVGIHLHKHVPIGHHVGGYNVGVVYFKPNETGIKVLKWWRDCVMDPTNKWNVPYGRVGDQAYLEAFEPLFGKENVFVMDESIGHVAPWNFMLLQCKQNRQITWNNKPQTVLFAHFSQFTPNWNANSYSIDRENGNTWGVYQLNNSHIKWYYDDYFDRLNKLKHLYNI